MQALMELLDDCAVNCPEADVTKMMKVPQLKVSGGFRQKRYEPSEKQLAAGVGSQRAHHGTVTGLTGPLGRRAA